MRKIRGLLIGYVVIILITCWPIASVATASLIASWNGCTLHEGNVNPCYVNGQDIGGTLYTMGMMGWFMIALIPLGAIAFIAWTTAWLVWYAVRRRKTRTI